MDILSVALLCVCIVWPLLLILFWIGRGLAVGLEKMLHQLRKPEILESEKMEDRLEVWICSCAYLNPLDPLMTTTLSDGRQLCRKCGTPKERTARMTTVKRKDYLVQAHYGYPVRRPVEAKDWLDDLLSGMGPEERL